jgi:hypothetical protein
MGPWFVEVITLALLYFGTWTLCETCIAPSGLGLADLMKQAGKRIGLWETGWMELCLFF